MHQTSLPYSSHVYHITAIEQPLINSSTRDKNGCHFTGNIFKCIFMFEKLCILIQMSLKFVAEGPGIDNK